MSDPVLIAVIVVGAIAFTRVSGVVLRFVVRRVANSSARVAAIEGLSGPTRWWRASVSRGVLDSADGGEGRRRQRVDSAARMLNHIVTVIVWIGVSIAIFKILDIDIAFFLTSAGFIGAGLAVGGQHKVNDYLTGLSVLFEDRYGIGDEIVIERTGAEPMRAVVEHIGLFTTRLRKADSTMHIPNGQMTVVLNLSQHAHVEKFVLHVGDDPVYDLVSERSAAEAVRQTAGQEHLTELIFVGDLAAERRDDGDIEVSVHTVKPLDARARRTIVRKAEQSLRGKR
jgi:small conductance mechanosensitive channel